MSRILLFIPAYNCETQILRVLKNLETEAINIVAKVLIVDNVSTDQTLETVTNHVRQSQYRSKYTVLRNSENYNLGGSHKIGLNYALENEYTHFAICHGDDQANPNDLVSVYEEKYSKLDCFMGARFLPDSRLEGYSRLKTLGNQLSNILFSIVTLKPIKELGSGLYVLKLEKFKNRFYLKFRDDLTFNYFLTLYMAKQRFDVVYFPISWREEDQISNVRIVRQTWILITTLWWFLVFGRRFFEQARGRTDFEYIIVEPVG